jgi:folate-binding Fe-S cluster repair protein YgfZ
MTWEGGAVIAPGADVVAGERSLGRVGSVAASRGLAMIRLDRAADALAAGTAITVDGVTLRFDKPGWVRFPYPDEMMAPAA